jgi:hypothetical protein
MTKLGLSMGSVVLATIRGDLCEEHRLAEMERNLIS